VDTYQLQTLFLKLLAIFFIFAILTNNSKKTIPLTIVYIAVISIAIHTLRDGLTGLYFSTSGITISFFLTIPIHFHFNNNTTKSKFAYSTAVGAITGPLGSILVFMIFFLIFFLFLAVSKFFKPQQLVLSNIQPMIIPIQGPTPGEENLKSQLARIEASRMDNENDYIDDIKSSERERNSLRLRFDPWKTILAMSTLAVIITGVFV
jgi:hypothetical protein